MKLQSIFRALLIPSLFLSAAALAGEYDWPQYRGPNRNGTATYPSLLTTWPAAGPKKLWTASVGNGFSGISVSNGLAYTLGNAKVDGKDTDTVFCFDAATGQEKWKKSYPAASVSWESRCAPYPGTGSTPTIDGDRVYTLSRDAQLHCFKADSGEIVWKKSLMEEYTFTQPEWRWGFAGSALVIDNMLIVHMNSKAAAFDKLTGKEIWLWADDKNDGGGYASPVVFENQGKKALAIFSLSLAALDIQTGKQLWKIPWQSSMHGLNGADPIFYDGQVFVSSGNYQRDNAVFDIGKPKAAWRNGDKQGGSMLVHFHTPILYKGDLYGFSDTKFRCVEFKTGKVKWEETGLVSTYGSLIMVNDKLLVMSDRGELLIVQADPSECKILARAQLIEKNAWTAPTLANGLLYVRNMKGDVACYELKK